MNAKSYTEMDNNKLDVVYVLGTGSNWNNNEIRFSLRSICRNLGNVRNVVIVGEKPEFLQNTNGNLVHIPAKDIFNPNINADGNIITKVLAACNDEYVSEDFLFINDDHLVLKPMDIGEVPALHKGNMYEFPNKYWEFNFWRSRLKRTRDVLWEHGLPANHYDCHTPIIFNKMDFIKTMSQFDYEEEIGYTMKSLYGNSIYKDKGRDITFEKKTIFKNYTVDQIYDRLKDAQFMSFNDMGLNSSLKWWLIENFRHKCEFEKDLPEDRIFDLYFWIKQGKNYKDGVAFYEKWYGKYMNLVRLFKSGDSEFLRKKLDYKLMQIVNEL